MYNKLFSVVSNIIGPRHYIALLASVLSLTVLAPLVDHFLWARIIVGGLVLISLLTASLAVAPSGHVALRAFIFGSLAGVMWILAFTCKINPFNTMHFQIAAYAATLLFFATACSAMWQDVFSGSVTTNRICGAVCLYILLGFCFAMLHMMVVLADPSAYRDSSNPNPKPIISGPLSAEERYPLFVYFSFCTLSTLGYGDVVPATRIARSLSWLEGLSGQLYLAILVARLVGLHVAGTTSNAIESPSTSIKKRELERSLRS